MSASAPTPRSSRGEATKRAVLDAAKSHRAKRGYHGTGLIAIGESAGSEAEAPARRTRDARGARAMKRNENRENLVRSLTSKLRACRVVAAAAALAACSSSDGSTTPSVDDELVLPRAGTLAPGSER